MHGISPKNFANYLAQGCIAAVHASKVNGVCHTLYPCRERRSAIRLTFEALDQRCQLHLQFVFMAISFHIGRVVKDRKRLRDNRRDERGGRENRFLNVQTPQLIDYQTTCPDLQINRACTSTRIGHYLSSQSIFLQPVVGSRMLAAAASRRSENHSANERRILLAASAFETHQKVYKGSCQRALSNGIPLRPRTCRPGQLGREHKRKNGRVERDRR